MPYITKRMPGLDGEDKFYVFKSNTPSFDRKKALALFSSYDGAKNFIDRKLALEKEQKEKRKIARKLL